ncbi:MAG: PfkB family carbohydrate kinase [Desulfosoma sp.]|uniref:PfkB family carbohydrate kinase n=1 Tax=Desulfosoma sp. TaxID=2603217 RepID=UPI004049BD24
MKKPHDLSWDVFGLGQCSLDYLGVIDRFPQADSKCECRDLTIQGGGPVATALVALSRWGKRCLMCGVVGDDPFGEVILHSLHSDGVHTDGVLVRPQCASQFAFIAAEPATARRTIFWRRPTGAPLHFNEVPWQEVHRSRVILTDGFFMDAALAVARKARAWNIPVVVDAGSLRDGMLDLARWSDHFIASEPFAKKLMGSEDPEGACRKLAGLGPEVVGVTLGARGSAYSFQGRLAFQEAYSVDVVDTTGCGDVFHGAYVYGLLKGWDVRKRFQRASWAAAQVARRLGGRAGIPSSLDEPMP